MVSSKTHKKMDQRITFQAASQNSLRSKPGMGRERGGRVDLTSEYWLNVRMSGSTRLNTFLQSKSAMPSSRLYSGPLYRKFRMSLVENAVSSKRVSRKSMTVGFLKVSCRHQRG